MDGPPASVDSVLLDFPKSPQPHPRFRFTVVVPGCLVWLVFPTRSGMTRFPLLVCLSPPPLGLLPMLLLPRLLTMMMKFLFRVSHAVLLCFRAMVVLRILFRAPVFLTFPPPPPLLLRAFNLPCRLAAVADAFSGIVNTNLHLLLHGLCIGRVRSVLNTPPRVRQPKVLPRNDGDLFIADQIQSTRHARHLETATGNDGPRQRPGRV
jgi:hypothetical protein